MPLTVRHLLDHSTPLVFHCTAGKDRTGFAAALLLGALGVSRDDILHDYLLTNRLYVRSPLVEARGPKHVMDVLWSVQPVFLEAAFATIEQDFGGLSRYLEGAMGLGPRELQQAITICRSEARAAFVSALTKFGLCATQGGRFLTLSKGATKADQIASLTAQLAPRARTMALGDAPNDLAMLMACDIGVIIPNPAHSGLTETAAPHLLRAPKAGPEGWAISVRAQLAQRSN